MGGGDAARPGRGAVHPHAGGDPHRPHPRQPKGRGIRHLVQHRRRIPPARLRRAHGRTARRAYARTPPAQRPRRLCGKEERSVAPHIRTPRLSVHGGIRVLSVYEAAVIEMARIFCYGVKMMGLW